MLECWTRNYFLYIEKQECLTIKSYSLEDTLSEELTIRALEIPSTIRRLNVFLWQNSDKTLYKIEIHHPEKPEISPEYQVNVKICSQSSESPKEIISILENLDYKKIENSDS